MTMDIAAIANRIRKWEFVESVRVSEKMPSYFGFKEQGLFQGYDLIIITEIESNAFLEIHHKRLKNMNISYEPLSYYTVGLILNKK